MNCPFCQQKLNYTDNPKYYCLKCPNSTILWFDELVDLLRYHIDLSNDYSIRVSFKTKTIRVYFQKDFHGITEPTMTILYSNQNINPTNAKYWTKRLLKINVFS